MRFATAEDRPALCQILAEQGRGDCADYVEECLAGQAQGTRAILIAEQDGRAAGFVIFNRKPIYSLYRRLGIPEIQDLNVIPVFRRRGVARALIARCEDIARAEGSDQLGISVGLHPGFGAAQRLYVRLGYVPDGYGVTYDRQTVSAGEVRPVDDNLCLMMVKILT